MEEGLLEAFVEKYELDDIDASCPEDVDEIDLSEKELTEIPKELFGLQLEGLTTICFESNLLTQLPEAIGSLRGVEQFYLRCNKLVRLPESIGDMEALDSLYLEDNQLTSEGIPESISKLSNLKGLCLHRNALQVDDVMVHLGENLKYRQYRNRYVA